MGALGVYRELVGNRPLVRLLTGEFVSGIGDWLYIIALFPLIYRETQSAFALAVFGAVRLLPYVFLSVPAGFVADRFDRRLVLLTSDLYRGSLMVVMAFIVAFHGPVLALAVLAILAACGSSFFYPAMGAYLPALAADERQLGPANSLWASLQNVSYVAGPAIGGLVLAIGSITVAFVLNALSFVFVAVILWSLPPSRPGARPASVSTSEPPSPSAAGDAGAAPTPTAMETASATGDAASSTGEPPTSPEATSAAPAAAPAGGTGLRRGPLAGLGLIQLVTGFLGGGYQVITTILAIQVLNAGDAGNGYLNAAIGIGGLLGAVIAGVLVLRRGMGGPIFLGAFVMGAGSVALGATRDLTIALATIGIASAGGLVLDVIGTTVFQRLVPDELRGRGFGILMTASTLTGAIGGFSMPILLNQLGPEAALGGSGIALIVFTAVGVVMVGTSGDRPPTPYEALLGRIRHLKLFAGVPRARLEAAMHQVVEVPVTAGTVVIRQGDTADRFYIISTGTFGVTQVKTPGGEPVALRTLGPDEVFGELGLLYETPRTATVTATSDGLLLALERDDFLVLVGASGPLRGRLLGLYSAVGVTR